LLKKLFASPIPVSVLSRFFMPFPPSFELYSFHISLL
jgi:hypothetical protein